MKVRREVGEVSRCFALPGKVVKWSPPKWVRQAARNNLDYHFEKTADYLIAALLQMFSSSCFLPLAGRDFDFTHSQSSQMVPSADMSLF